MLVESITLYDADDRTWKVTDQNGKTTETQYNSIGQVAVTIDPFGGRTTYDYDVRGNLNGSSLVRWHRMSERMDAHFE